MMKVTIAVALLALLAASAAAATTNDRRLLQASPATAATVASDPDLKTFQPSQCNKMPRGIVVCPVGRTYSCCDSAECNSVRDIKKAVKEAGVGLSARQLCSLGAQSSGIEVYYACCKA